MTARYGVRQGVVEALLILALTLWAAPLRRWLERRFKRLFEREAALYREVVTRIDFTRRNKATARATRVRRTANC